MWTVKQNMFLILNSVPVTLVTDPEFIRPSVPVIAHFLNQEVVARKAKARKCAAEVAGNIHAVESREAAQVYDFFFCRPTSQEYSPKAHENECDMFSLSCWNDEPHMK
jgi:hypothetical protein